MCIQLHPWLTSQFQKSASCGTFPLALSLLSVFLCIASGVGIARAQSSQSSQPNYPPITPMVPSIPGNSSRASGAPQQPSLADMRIGVVKALRGKWCRSGSQLKKGVDVYWNDDVRYCPTAFGAKDKIQIDFDRKPPEAPFSGTYKCSTPGICSDHEKLWLQGAYKYGQIPHGSPTVLISAPKLRSSILPDVVVPAGSNTDALPPSIVSSTSGQSVVICRIYANKPRDCSPPSSNSEISAAREPGLYGVYLASADKDQPSALLLLTNAHSDLPERWASVPEAFREDSSADVVQQRRSFLLDLYKSEGQANADEQGIAGAPR